MTDHNKRSNTRKTIHLTTYVRKELPGGGYSLTQFVSRDLSEGGIFIGTDDLSLFDVGETISIIVDRERVHLFEGQARVVRSSRIFGFVDKITESGFGLSFVGRNSGFSEMLKQQLSRELSADNGVSSSGS